MRGPLALISVLASSRGHWHEKRLRNEDDGGRGEIKGEHRSKEGRMQLKERVTNRGARHQCD